jgi:hypothetical protein
MANNWNVPDAVHRNTPEYYKLVMIPNSHSKLYIIIGVIFLKPGLIKPIARIIIAFPNVRMNLSPAYRG